MFRKIITIGRISPLKNYETFIRALKISKNQNFEADIIGNPGSDSNKQYMNNMQSLIKNLGMEDRVKFKGALPHNQVKSALCDADFFVNMQCGGGVGKAALEAMSCGLPTLVCAEDYYKDHPDLAELFFWKNTGEFAEKINKCLNMSDEELADYGKRVREIVIQNHNLDNLISQFIRHLS